VSYSQPISKIAHWKAAHYLDQHDAEGQAVGAMAKIFCGETLFPAVFRTMQAMGVNSLDRRHPMEKFLREAAVFPLYDAGNIGMQMRKLWGVMLDPEFDPRAIADSRAIKFKKSMEGHGTLVEAPPLPAVKAGRPVRRAPRAKA
jgi:nitroalkane oxidase